MFCVNCGTAMKEDEKFCTNCGAQAVEDQPAVSNAAPAPAAEPVSAKAAKAPETRVVYKVPEENKPLGPWAYFGLQLLLNLPVIGFIFAIILSFNKNINCKNFVRAYWCVLLIVAILAVIAIVVALLFGAPLLALLGIPVAG